MGALNEELDNFCLAHAFSFGELVELYPGGIREREVSLSLASAVGVGLLGLESLLDLLKVMKLFLLAERCAI